MILSLIEDTRQKPGKHTIKNAFWYIMGITVTRYGLPVGDYVLADPIILDAIAQNIEADKILEMRIIKRSVDTKKDVNELYSNICSRDHRRFKQECVRAQEHGIKLYILVENEIGIQKLSDLIGWNNKRSRRKRKPNEGSDGERMMKSCRTMEKRYGVRFLFCRPDQAAVRVIELLRGDFDGKT